MEILVLYILHIGFYWGTVFYCSKFPTNKSSKSFKEISFLVLFNQLIITPILFSIFIPYLQKNLIITNLTLNYYYFIQYVFTGTIVIFIRLFFLNILFANLHYLFHRNKFLFTNIHYLHHELVITQGAGAIYCHSLEHIIVNLLPVIIPMILFPSDLFWTSLFICFVSYETVIGHTSFEDQRITSRHNLHHKLFNINFDNFPYLFDKIIGTYKDIR